MPPTTKNTPIIDTLMSSSITINFVLPFIEKTGGVIVVFEHAKQLIRMGHSVTVFYPFVPYPDMFFGVPTWKKPYVMVRYALRAWIRRMSPAPWFPDAPPIRMIPLISGSFMPIGDVVIATAWPTSYSVARLPSSRGRKYYFIQHYETWTGNIPAIDASFSLNLRLITIAPWLTDLMREKFGKTVAAEIHNGIDLDVYRPPLSKPDAPLTVLMMYHVTAYKGTSDGLEVLRKISSRHPEVRIRLFGQYGWDADDGRFEYTLNPTPPELVGLYQSAHIFLSPSLSEGWHLPPMEAMACGCALVATTVGCIPVLNQGENMLTATPGDVEGLYLAVNRLIGDSPLRHQIANRGLETIRKYTWPLKSYEFEQVLLGNAADNSNRHKQIAPSIKA